MSDSNTISIKCVAPEEEANILPQLIPLLQDTVASGATIGFLPPLSTEDAQQYWKTVFQDITQDARILVVAHDADQIVGSVQLVFATQSNARHRATIQKLFVHPSQHRRGIGRKLMHMIEQVTRDRKRTLLILNTRQNDHAEQLYRSLGYHETGIIPAYTQNADGNFDNTIVFYKILS